MITQLTMTRLSRCSTGYGKENWKNSNGTYNGLIRSVLSEAYGFIDRAKVLDCILIEKERMDDFLEDKGRD